MTLPVGFEEVERKRFGPFTTARVLRRPDGTLLEFSAWQHRKGYGLIDRSGASMPEHVDWWEPTRRDWWIGVLFMVGSACFAIGSIPIAADALGRAAPWIFFVGSVFFTSAAYLQYFEATNEGDALDASGRTRHLFGVRRKSIGWWASFIQFLGTLAFNVTTFAGTLVLTTQKAERWVWAPDVVGSIFFLIASWLVIAETHDRIRGMLFRSLESRIAGLNMIGSIAFGISAIGAFILPSSGELLSLPIVNIFTFIGAVCFFLGAALLIPAMRPDPVTQQVVAT